MVKSQYNNQVAAMATMHDKGRLVSEHFQNILQMKIEEVRVDTDALGTFSGEIERTGTHLETAFRKARLGLEATGLPYAIASEGSVGADPQLIFINANIETMVFIDEILGIQIHETYKSNDIVAFTTTTQEDNLQEFLLKADFPNHKVIVKPKDGPGAIKGIGTLSDLQKAVRKARTISSDGEAIIESDLRAMSSPSRQRNISIAASKLAKRLSQICPECLTPGWGVKGFLKGVECSECGELSEKALRQEELGCIKCEFRALGAVINLSLDPSECMGCNP